LDPDAKLTPYDKKMNANRAQELHDDVKQDLKRRIRTGDYEEVIVNMGRYYRTTIQGLDDEVEVPIRFIDGKLGERGRKLKQEIRQNTTPSFGAE